MAFSELQSTFSGTQFATHLYLSTTRSAVQNEVICNEILQLLHHQSSPPRISKRENTLADFLHGKEKEEKISEEEKLHQFIKY